MRPLWTLLELGLDHELVTLRFPPRVFEKEYLAVNPLGTVPLLVDGAIRMTESVAICQYLVERYGPSPLRVAPSDDDYPAYVDWLHRSDATLTFPLTLVLRYSALEPPDRRIPQVAEDYRKWFLGRLRCLETALADREFLCAGRFTIADVCVGYALHLAEAIGVTEAFSVPVSRYWQRLKMRPAFVECSLR
jgi:glutathione S-transferase